MIRAKLSNGDLLFGIDAENVRRLVADNPLVIDCHQMGYPFRILITYGDTLAEIQARLERISGPLPPATPYVPGPEEAQ
jgi:hypothetical protein